MGSNLWFMRTCASVVILTVVASASVLSVSKSLAQQTTGGKRPAPASAQPFVKTGMELFKQGKYQAALVEFDKAVNADPKSSAAYEWRGRTRLRMTGSLEPISDFDQALKLNPRNTGALNSRGSTYLGVGDLGRALADYNAVLALDPSNAAAYAFRGLTYSQMGDSKRGLEDIATAIKIAPNFPPSYGNMGQIYSFQLRQYDKALDAFNKQLQLDPVGTSPFFHSRGWAYLNLGDDDAALADFNRALVINPANGNALGYLGRIFVEKGQYDLALKDLTEFSAAFAKKCRCTDMAREGLRTVGQSSCSS